MPHFDEWPVWVAAALGALLLGSVWSGRARAPHGRRTRALIVSGVALVLCIAAYWTHALQDATGAPHASTFGGLLELDALGAPMLPVIALAAMLTILGTLRPKALRLNFPRILVQTCLHVALFSASTGWPLIALLAATAVPSALDLRARGGALRLYVVMQGLATLLLAGGWALAGTAHAGTATDGVAAALLVTGVAIRCGLFPAHLWVLELFETGPFGGALLATVPLAGLLAAARLLPGHITPHAAAALTALALLAAFHAAGMALVQRSARRFYAYLLLSYGALAVAGIGLGTRLSITGALCLWVSTALAMTGLGLTLRSLEARTGRLRLDAFMGLHTQTPTLAAFFLVTGLAAVGFPGTIGFFGTDLLVEGGQEVFGFAPAVVICAALNGIAVVRAYGILFLGTRHPGTVDLRCRRSERLAMLSLTVILIAGVLYATSAIGGRYAASGGLLQTPP